MALPVSLSLVSHFPHWLWSFAGWLTVAGRSAATVTQIGCPPSLALLFLTDLEAQNSIKINLNHLWGSQCPYPPSCQQVIQFLISSGSVHRPQRSSNLVGPVIPTQVREMTQPLTDPNATAFKTIKLQVCYATTANGYNCPNSKVIFRS